MAWQSWKFRTALTPSHICTCIGRDILRNFWSVAAGYNIQVNDKAMLPGVYCTVANTMHGMLLLFIQHLPSLGRVWFS